MSAGTIKDFRDGCRDAAEDAKRGEVGGGGKAINLMWFIPSEDTET